MKLKLYINNIQYFISKLQISLKKITELVEARIKANNLSNEKSRQIDYEQFQFFVETTGQIVFIFISYKNPINMTQK